MTWFDSLTGFPERSADFVRSNLRSDGSRFTSLANGRTFDAGRFTTPLLSQLRQNAITGTGRNIAVKEVVADVRDLHQDVSNANAVFQVASQFNCLEMASPGATPEDGVGIYEYDKTQGPACSICAGAGTIYRNYFVDVNGCTGQSRDNQIDCLADMAKVFGGDLWRMQNGYCLPTASGLDTVETLLSSCEPAELDRLCGELKVGVQSGTEVTVADTGHLVTQVFCSGLPLAYSNVSSSDWDYFPRLILDATYEATFHIAVQNLLDTGSNKLYLTLVGGGVFGNRMEWIFSAIDRSLRLFSWATLDVGIVSYGSSEPRLVEFINARS